MDKLHKSKLEARFFKTSKGNEPTREWIKSLPRDDKAIIGQDIQTVQFGWPIGMPLVKHLESGIWEIRISLLRKRIAGILFFLDQDIIIIVNGFIKKTQKTPKEELSLAKKRMAQYCKVNRGK